MTENAARPEDQAQASGGDQTVWAKEPSPEDSRRRAAMIVSVLLFVGIYAWGVISGLMSLGQPKGETQTAE